MEARDINIVITINSSGKIKGSLPEIDAIFKPGFQTCKEICPAFGVLF